MNEPGWGAVVTAGVRQHNERLHWQRVNASVWHWECRNPDEAPRDWDEPIDPEIVHPGPPDEDEP